MKPQRIVWHHSAYQSSGNQVEKVNQWHKGRLFKKSLLGWYVGYHYFIEKNGLIIKTRGEYEIGSHDAGENQNSIGICLAGDFNKELPTDAQAAALAECIAGLRSRHSIPVSRIEPHRWDDTTDCPGTQLPDNWATEQYLTRSATPLLRSFWWIAQTFKLL